jgi:GDP-4-dehydro-6-deoxy-D-mannose reductase
MRILISGANGFVGTHLIAHLRHVEPEAEIIGLVHGQQQPGEKDPYQTIPCDITANDGAEIRAVIRETRPDHVYHLAGAASGAGQDREAIFRVNVDGTRAVMEAVQEHAPLARVLFTSTGYVYGDCDPEHPVREEYPLHPVGLYAESKRDAEPYARAAGAVVARSFNHTGPGQTPSFAIPAFAAQIAAIETGAQAPELRVGNLEALRDFLDVRDVVRAYHLLITRAEPGVYNVCSGQAYPMRLLLDQLVALSAVPIAIANDPARMRPADLAVSVGDPAKLKQQTGWTPEISLADTLRETLDWWRLRQ